jgi:TusA-related sulfurtransferase
MMRVAPVREESQTEKATTAEQFLAALTSQDFAAVEALFHPEVRFRALTATSTREVRDAGTATGWLKRWFGTARVAEVVHSAVGMLADRHHVTYRLRLLEDDGWYLIEQQAYLTVENGTICDVALLCSGFLPDPERGSADADAGGGGQTVRACFLADAFYDAGAKGCAEGPLEEIAAQMRRLQSGQLLEVRATATSVMADLPAWCRLAGHELVSQEGDRYLLRHR